MDKPKQPKSFNDFFNPASSAGQPLQLANSDFVPQTRREFSIPYNAPIDQVSPKSFDMIDP
jgi:hypothetical protein